MSRQTSSSLRTFLGLAAAGALAVFAAAPRAQGPVYPGASWASSSPESQGLDGAALRAGLAALPGGAGAGPLVVIANGYLVHSVGPVSTPLRTYSCSKTLTAALVARLLQQRRIASLDALVPNTVQGAWGPAYPGDASFRHFLTMTSEYGFPSPRQPGIRYAYNNHAVDFLGEYLARSFFGVGHDRMHDVMRAALFDPIGRQDALGFHGHWGGWGGGLETSCRDLARVGLLLARGGVWQGQPLLDPGFVASLFRDQLPSNAVRYQGPSGENSEWNQQEVTDRLAGAFSFLGWRAGDRRTGGTWRAFAMDGYLGKRVLVCPKGSLPDPALELVFVTLASLASEGPDPSAYLAALTGAVRVPANHPEHDPRCLLATFDSGTNPALVPRFGGPYATAGVLRLPVETQLDLPAAPLDDQIAILRVASPLPRGASLGVVMRASTPGAGAFHPVGVQTWVGVEHAANGSLRALVARPLGGSMVWWAGPALQSTSAQQAFVMRVELVGDRLDLTVNDEIAIPGGRSGMGVLQGGGYFAIRSRMHVQPIDLDYVLLRPKQGPVAQVASEAAGDHAIAFVADGSFANLPLGSLRIHYDDLTLGASELPLFLPWIWPTIAGMGSDHLVLGHDNAPIPLAPRNSLVIELGAHREGEILR